MSKKTRRKKRQQKRQTALSQLSWPWLAALGAVVLIGGALFLLRPGSDGTKPQVSLEVSGAPRLKVDQTTIDEGYVKYEVPVRTTFRLSNVGDQPLEILNQPQVKLVQGC